MTDKTIYKIVERQIRTWDPYGLLAGGAPEDEFDAEIEAVVSRLGVGMSPQDIAGVVSGIFSHTFEPEYFEVNNCKEVAEAIFRAMNARSDS